MSKCNRCGLEPLFHEECPEAIVEGCTVALKGVVTEITNGDEVTIQIGDGPTYAFLTLNIEAVVKL